MRFSIVTPNRNGGRFLEQALTSVINQAADGIDLEYIVVDGGSTDCSLELIGRHSRNIAHAVVGKDSGPANAINKGLAMASGDVLAWLNADDMYCPGTLLRVLHAMQRSPEAAFCFGSCPMIGEQGHQIRTGITRFKEAFYPLSSRFTYQCLNYLSQPALFFRRTAFEQAGPLREDMAAAWDYEFILRLWQCGHAVQVSGCPLAVFRWHEQSISGQNFSVQFREEYEAARADAGRFSLQSFIHFFVRWGIVGVYSLMALSRRSRKRAEEACE